jgi:hypothetical protein
VTTTLDRYEHVVEQLEKVRRERRRRNLNPQRRIQLSRRIDQLLDEYLAISQEAGQTPSS